MNQKSRISHSAVMLVPEAPQNTLFPWADAPDQGEIGSAVVQAVGSFLLPHIE